MARVEVNCELRTMRPSYQLEVLAEQLKLLGVMYLPAKKATAAARFAACDGWIPSQLK